MKRLILLSTLLLALSSVRAGETIRVAIGTQDTTINCATGGILPRELKLVENTCPTTANTKTSNTKSSGKTSRPARRSPMK